MFAPAKRKKSKRRRRIPAKATRRWHVELEQARRDPIVFIEYVFQIKLDEVQKAWAKFWIENRKTVLHGSIGLGKCHSPDTPVLLSDGHWKRIADVRAGDEVAVFDPRYMKHTTAPVRAAFSCGTKKVLRLRFKSGRSLDVAATHPLYTVHGWRRAKDLDIGEGIACPRQLPEGRGELSVNDAAILGYFVGDGGTTVHTTFTNADAEIIEHFRNCLAERGWQIRKVQSSKYGYSVSRIDRKSPDVPRYFCARHGIQCKSIHKRVPPEVMRASDDAVAAFLGTYFACDGYVAKSQLELDSASRELLEDCQLLLRRFGIASWLCDRTVNLDGKVFDAYRLSVTAAEDIERFRRRVPVPGVKTDRLARMKLRWPTRVGSGSHDVVPRGWQDYMSCSVSSARKRGVNFMAAAKRGNHRTVVRAVGRLTDSLRLQRLGSDEVFWDPIVGIELLGEMECFDIEVDHSAHCYIASGFVSHNSLLMRGMALWFMGRDPNVQIIWLSATQRQPKKHLSLLATLIEADGARSRLHHVFPRLKPGNTWRSTELTVDREVDPLEADYTVSVYGAYSDSLLGSRATILIVDDLCNFSNTLTEDGRSKMIEWLATVLSRLTTPDYRMMVIGNFWHEQDATRDLAKTKGFEYMKTPAFVRDEAGEMIPTAPAAMPVPTIIEKIKELGPRRAKQMLECEAADTNLGRFKDIYFARALELGRRLPFRPKREYEPCFTGIDLGSGKAPGSDRTAMVTVKLRADGKRQVVDVRSGCWEAEQITRNLRDVKRRYNTTVAVENNGIQKLVIGFLRDATVMPLKEHNTNAVNKRDLAYGVEGLATEMSEGLWVFPCGDAATFDPRSGMTEDEDSEPHEELQALIGEALTFDPTKPREHTGDRLMAWWICVSVMWKSALFELDEIDLDLDAPTHNIFDR